MTSVQVISVIVCSYFMGAFVLSAPIHDVAASNPSAIPPASAIRFMKQFGYLEQGTADSEALYTEQSIVEAIKTVQRYGAIPETGTVDNATLKLMVSKRCGVPDIARQKERQKRFVIGSRGWNKRVITYFVANWSPKVGEEAVRKEIQRAFDAWGGYARLTFRPVWDNNADIIVVFGRGSHGDWYPFDGPGNILAHAYYPYEMGHLGGDVHFDEDENWKIQPKEYENGVDFFTVAVHELGHSLGLSHSPVRESIMFPYYKGYEPNVQIGYDDILAMYKLYISRQLEGDDQLVNAPDTRAEETDGVEEDAADRGSNEDEPVDTSTQSGDTDSEHTDDRTHEHTTQRPTVTFVGDDESVDHHKTHDPHHGIPTSPTSPDICNGNYDAITILRGELFIFKNEYMWRLSERGEVLQGYPVPFRQMFWKLPKSITKIDAAYQRTTDESIILFTGDKYWVYDGRDFIEGSPRPLADYGLPQHLKNVDAVQVWQKNGKLFFYSGDQYWRYNETTRTMDPNYPQDIARWRGVPRDLDAAMTWKDGFTYFFKGRLFWRFDNTFIKTDSRYPLPAPQHWLGCPERPDTIWWN